MTAAHTLQRSLIVGFAAIAAALTLAGTASAETPKIPDSVVVVSSTQLGSGSFTMTATNLGDAPVDLYLVAPGNVSGVSTDSGSFDGHWVIDDLASGSIATMTGSLEP